MRSIAERLGVHVATVSLALRGDPRVAVVTRQRVAAAAAELGYRPNPLVQSLMRTRRSSRSDGSVAVAFVHPSPMDSERDIQITFRGFAEQAGRRGVAADAILSKPSAAIGQLNRVLRHRGIDGIAFSQSRRPYAVTELDWHRFALAAVGYSLKAPILHRVSADHFDACFQHLHACAGRGYRRVGLVTSPPQDYERIRRWAGAYTLAMRMDLGVELAEPFIGTKDELPRLTAWIDAGRLDAILTVPWFRPHILAAFKRLSRSPLPIIKLDSEPDTGEDRPEATLLEFGARTLDLLLHLLERNDRGIPARPCTWMFPQAAPAPTPTCTPLFQRCAIRPD